jgi:uroporphyrinogen decarboxylase
MPPRNALPPETRRLLRVLQGEPLSPPPIWLMRQAGRYLPEYRATRAQAGGFLDLCYRPDLAAEVTLQPIRRYGFDAAILFADILIVPDALGRSVRFLEGEGPQLDPIQSRDDIGRLDRKGALKKYSIIAETVQRLRQDLPSETTLIGFCGAPWTVATYMIGGSGSSDQAAARTLAYRDPVGFQALIDILVETSVDYLALQVAAGADTVQIFDSWAGNLPEDEYRRWVIAPTAALIQRLRARGVTCPVIGFPRGNPLHLLAYAAETGAAAVGCDTTVTLAAMRALAAKTAVQGNLDPLLLVAGGAAMDARIDAILEACRGSRLIFNLGHGIVPETPPDHVARLVQRVREHKF